MTVYYLDDPILRTQKNAQSQIHWTAYLPEMLLRLGVSAKPWRPGQKAEFQKGDVLFAGGDDVNPEIVVALEKSLEQGLMLIGFASTGADRLFGISTDGKIFQSSDEFSLTGYFSININVQKNYLNVPEMQPALPVFSPIISASAVQAKVLGYATVSDENCAAFFRHGNAYYFAFDLPRTLWIAAQGRPVTENAPGFPAGRIVMSRVAPPDYNTEIAFGDYYLYILQNILANQGYAMLHRLPPDENGTIPDLLLYYAGDEDACNPEISFDAADVMATRGLPYHLNLMPHGENIDFRLSRAQFDALRKRGCELSLHYNMAEKYDWCAFTQESFSRQHRSYLQHFGIPCISTVGHCLIQNGWAERVRYQEKLGICGDFGRMAEIDPTDINAFNLYGFAFGTAFPFFSFDDAAHSSRRMDFVEAPIAYYEPRVGENYPGSTKKIAKCIDSAVFFGRMINIFTHPHYLTVLYKDSDGESQVPFTIAAFDEFVRCISQNGYQVTHSTPDRICEFWRERDRSTIDSCFDSERIAKYYIDSASDAIALRIPVDEKKIAGTVSVDSNPISPEYKEIDGRLWLMVPVYGKGSHIIEINQE